MKEYDGMFVAIYDEKVVERGKDPSELREKTLAKGLRLSEVLGGYVSKKPLEFILCLKGNKLEEECLTTNMRSVF